MTVIFVGQAPARRPDPLGPLTGRSFARLCRWCGWDLAEYAGKVQRCNLLPRYLGRTGLGDAFDVRAARAKATVLRRSLPCYHGVIVGFGRHVGAILPRLFDSFGTLDGVRVMVRPHRLDFYETYYDQPSLSFNCAGKPIIPNVYACLPHPSGASHVWNDPAERARVAAFLNDLVGKPLGLSNAFRAQAA